MNKKTREKEEKFSRWKQRKKVIHFKFLLKTENFVLAVNASTWEERTKKAFYLLRIQIII